MKELYDAVENHFVPEYSRAQQKAQMYAIVLKLFVSYVLLVMGLACTGYYGMSYFENGVDSMSTLVATVGTLLASFGVVGSAIWSYFSAPLKASDQFVKDVASANFRKKLGFTNIVKQQLFSIGNMLKDPSDLPNVWDCMLPDWFDDYLSRDYIKRILVFIFGGGVQGKPCKLVIFVDDLDRCEPAKAVEVLQSLVLLIENTPFVIFLAIDPRIVVTAIESVNKKFFSETGVTGCEYLDKIVQIPFSIPIIVDNEKENLCRGYLSGIYEKMYFCVESILIVSMYIIVSILCAFVIVSHIQSHPVTVTVTHTQSQSQSVTVSHTQSHTVTHTQSHTHKHTHTYTHTITVTVIHSQSQSVTVSHTQS